MLLGGMWGCGRNVDMDELVDDLRRERLTLEDRVKELEAFNAGLTKQLADERKRKVGVKLPDGVVEARFVKVRIGAYSGGVDTDRDGELDAVRLYVETLDAKGRFVQVVGRAKVSVVVVRPGEEAVTVGKGEFDAVGFDATYRAGLAGTHYTLVVKVGGDVPKGVEEVTVRVGVEDLKNGGVNEVEKVVRWK